MHALSPLHYKPLTVFFSHCKLNPDGSHRRDPKPATSDDRPQADAEKLKEMRQSTEA